MSEKPKRMAIIAGKGQLDEAFPPMILASTAAALDMEVAIFFTFYGLNLISKKKVNIKKGKDSLKVSPVGNAAMPGPKIPILGWTMPVAQIMAIIPGMTWFATKMMRSWMKKAHVATYAELLEACIDADVKLIGCQMTMDVFGYKKEDLIDGIEIAGAASFLEFAQEADITLYM
ncbi:MAG: hypothetical protein HeimC3_01820 [Candidatus Heimdallarchaeota archaeon LC_3]|nr:MAG: hypothetical protein HeimC3_01820 [Candidatus Heimdallarchaeota archaeon LC_3]